MPEIEPDTIYAPATGMGRSALAVIRISGPAAFALGDRLCGAPAPAPRTMALRNLKGPDGALIDQGLLVRFPGPASFTGEDMIELHIHGGIASMDAVMAAIAAGDLARIAAPGEFTRRAFYNGKLDLARAEAVGDLINAETGLQQRQALRQLDGRQSRLYEDWRKRLIRCLGHIESEIDFVEEDLPEDLSIAARAPIAALCDEIDAHLQDNRRGERLRHGLRVALVGRPNVGKSSLLNCLAARDVAIVSPIAGTTRDLIEVHLDLQGYPVTLVDTAGIRDSSDDIERIGVARARQQGETADLILSLSDPDSTALTKTWPDDTATLAVLNKVDLLKEGAVPSEGIAISATQGTGIADLLAKITEMARLLCGDGSVTAITNHRHREALQECREALCLAKREEQPELLAEALRRATWSLGRITGRVDIEDVLEQVFAEFCIGK